MASPELTVELDPGPWNDPEWDGFYAVEGRITGRVRVTADEATTCRRLFASLAWHTEGRGDKDEQIVRELTLAESEIRAGESSHEFQFDLPTGPVSYAGHYINIIWAVRAQLDLAWKFDPKAEARFHLTLP